MQKNPITFNKGLCLNLIWRLFLQLCTGVLNILHGINSNTIIIYSIYQSITLSRNKEWSISRFDIYTLVQK